ncbi:kinesin light chain [Pyricularia oryzae]|nr:kinesin light chain [Pyricularia oryzae]
MLAGHNVVIVTCAPEMTGNVNASRVTGPMFRTFSCLRMAVLVGIGGGIPRVQPSDDPTEDVHLGDVVVGWPGDGGPAVEGEVDAGRQGCIPALNCNLFCVDLHFARFLSLAAYQGSIV